ncbi:hypothetical protein D3C86_1707140 [compost metagenome]
MATGEFHPLRYPTLNFGTYGIEAAKEPATADFFFQLFADQLLDVLARTWRIFTGTVTFHAVLATGFLVFTEAFANEVPGRADKLVGTGTQQPLFLTLLVFPFDTTTARRRDRFF